jgi:CDP-glucose 4,6-dehydratase
MSFNFGPDSKVNKNVGELIEEMKNKWTECPGWINKFINDDKPEANLLKLSCDRANILLKWYPVMDFIETVDFTMNWYLNYYKLKSNVFDFTIKQINEYTNKAKDRNILWSIN